MATYKNVKFNRYPESRKELAKALVFQFEHLWDIASEWDYHNKADAFWAGAQYWGDYWEHDHYEYADDILGECFDSGKDYDRWLEAFVDDVMEEKGLDDDEYDEVYERLDEWYSKELKFDATVEAVKKHLFSFDFDPKTLVNVNLNDWTEGYGQTVYHPKTELDWINWLDGLTHIDGYTLRSAFDTMDPYGDMEFTDERWIPWMDRALAEADEVDWRFSNGPSTRMRLCWQKAWLMDEEFVNDLEFDTYYDPEGASIEIWEAMQEDLLLRERVSSRHPWLYGELRAHYDQVNAEKKEKEDYEDERKSEELEFLDTPEGQAYLEEIEEKQAYSILSSQTINEFNQLENERNVLLARYEGWVWDGFDPFIEEVQLERWGDEACMDEIDPDRYRKALELQANLDFFRSQEKVLGEKVAFAKACKGNLNFPFPQKSNAWLMRKIKSTFNLPYSNKTIAQLASS